MERMKVKSSNINSIGYDELTKTLEVEFSNNGIYQYKEVPKEVYEGFSKAESIGSYFAKNVRTKGYTYLKIECKHDGDTMSILNGSDEGKLRCCKCNKIFKPEEKK